MKYSILLRHFDPDHKLCEMAKECMHSIISNSTGEDYEIIVLDRPGIAGDFNRGFAQARGEYIVVVANDCIIQDPDWLKKFPIPGTITGWRESSGEFNKDIVDFSAAFCIPREVWARIGDFDTGFEGYGYEDDDFFYRAKQLGIPFQVVPVKLVHNESATFKAYNRDMNADLIKNRAYFYQKHFGNK